MAKTSLIENNEKRRKMADLYKARRTALKAVVQNKNSSLEDRMEATMKLAEMPRNSCVNRVRNRCEISGRPRAFYRKFKMSRIALRELGSLGLIPGLTKASW